MFLTQYTLTFEKKDVADAHFELRIDDKNRPFHIVLKPQRSKFGMNRLQAGEWGEEIEYDLPVKFDDVRTILVEVCGDTVKVLIGDVAYTFKMDTSQSKKHLRAAGKNTSWEYVVRPVKGGDVRKGGKIQSETVNTVHILGRDLKIPTDVPPEVANRLAQDAAVDNGSYLRFMTSRPVAKTGQVVLVDIDPNTFVYALYGCLLAPSAKVMKLFRDREIQDTFLSIAAANGITNAVACSKEEIVELLENGDEAVVLQGGLAFDLLGDVLAKLPEGNRKKLSIWSVASEVVPGNIAFPCANIQLWAPPNWTLNHNSSISTSGRRPGVDVTVAAYNARDYLIECTESLLCDNRDDVRVIIVDDGSSDGCGEEAAAYFIDEPRVRVERKPNGGCASARNYGRLVSDATHIAFVDADDFVTDGFFGDLYDLALYSGCEVTQGGFDFYDDSLEEPYYESYEEELFKDLPRNSFKGQSVIWLPSQDIIKGQPTIWRKVYRRDFLDAKNIYFPENVRAYDDYIFQMFTLTAARDILMMPEHKYHYRQHAAQDIKQGDERHFYMMFMFQMLIKRSIAEGWPNFRPYAESIVDCISWSSSILRPNLVDAFLASGARFCVGMAKCYGDSIMDGLFDRIEHPDFIYHYENEMEKCADIAPGAFWAFFNGSLYHPDMIHMRQSMLKAS